jgi:cell division septal protein FtsQ
MAVSEKYLKDYKVVDYQNPRLRKKVQEQQRRGALAFFSIFLIIAGGLLYFFGFSPFFLIKNVNVQSETVAPEAIIEKIDEQMALKFLWIFSRENIWFFDTQKLADEISKNYFWEELEIKKHYPSGIDVVLSEKIAVMHWLKGGQCYKTDVNGLIIGFCGEGTTSMSAPAVVLEVRDLRPAENLSAGFFVADQEEIKYISDLDAGFKNALGVDAKSYEFSEAHDEIKIYLKQGPEIYLNAAGSVGEAISRLSVLFDKEINKKDIGKIGYIDMRFGEKIYYQ